MNKQRLRYSKTGTAKYISHLDLMDTMRRAMNRAGVGLKYSEGFNPHPYISVALPLPVGCESICELMDIGLDDGARADDIAERVSASLPGGLSISEAYTPARKFIDIQWIGISGRLHYDRGAPDDAVKRLIERFRAESIIISKKTKRGETEIDIAPFIKDVVIAGDNVISFDAKISAQNPSLSPENMMSSLTGEFGELAPDFAVFSRMEIFDSDMLIFR